MGILVQLEPFDYSIVNIDRQAPVYDLLFEPSSSRNIPTSSINHDWSVKTDGVVNTSVNKVNEIIVNKVDNFSDKFSTKMYKQDKGVDILFKEVTTLVPLSWTPKLYAIFLCEVSIMQNIWLCIYLDVTHDNLIESINGINVLYENRHFKIDLWYSKSLACSLSKVDLFDD